eukprot:g2124.t1
MAETAQVQNGFLVVLLLLLAASVPSASATISGTWSGALLPIAPDGTDAIIWPQLNKTVEALLSSGIDGVYTSGTAEELWTLTDAEFVQLGDLVSKAAKAAGKPFQIGCSHPSPQISLARVKVAVERWPDALALQVALPDWFPVTNLEAAAFLDRVAATVSTATGAASDGKGPGPGLVLYNPGNAKRKLLPADYALSQNLTRHLVGIKVVDGDVGWYAGIRAAVQELAAATGGRKLSVGVPGHHLATGVVAEGVATCSYSNVAALSPSGAARWYRDMVSGDASRRAGALALERKINQFFLDHVVPYGAAGFSDMALDKLLATAGNWVEGMTTQLRWPYNSILQSEAEALRPVVRKALPELF